MEFLSAGIPIGRWWGITVRLHFTFLLFAFYRMTTVGHLGYGLAFVIGLCVSILLHEYGHALAARWCDGEAEEILLWPLGGLAVCRPAWQPTAHLICTVAGPFVTLVLWLFFCGLSWFLGDVVAKWVSLPSGVLWFVKQMRWLNLWLLIFNVCVPAFPMDGGRILRDTIWHWMSAERATLIAITLSQVIGVLALLWAAAALTSPEVVPPPPISPWWMIALFVFILSACANERRIVAAEAGGEYSFSLRERLRRGRRQRGFRKAIDARTAADEAEAFHRCAQCGRTERDSKDLEFRVCTDCANGEEYCQEHLDKHQHTRPLATGKGHS